MRGPVVDHHVIFFFQKKKKKDGELWLMFPDQEVMSVWLEIVT